MSKKLNPKQGLHIANVNAQNEIVLNDELLLRLLLKFPFLYNPELKPFNDSDYDSYAWKQITIDFNRSYENLNPNIYYSTEQLQERWMIILPTINRLSKISNLKKIPQPLRDMIIKLTNNEMRFVSFKMPWTPAQIIIHQNIPMVEKLTLLQRRQLEAEMMELILQTELDSETDIELTPSVQNYIEKEDQEFMKAIDLKETEVENLNKDASSAKGIEVKNANKNTTVGNSSGFQTKILNLNEFDNSNALNTEPELINPTQLIKTKPKTLNTKHVICLNSPLPCKNPGNRNAIGSENIEVDNDKILKSNKINNKNTLKIEPEIIIPTELTEIKQETLDTNNVVLSSKSPWVPLGQWQKYVRKCRVRVKRTKPREDLVLKKINRRKTRL